MKETVKDFILTLHAEIVKNYGWLEAKDVRVSTRLVMTMAEMFRQFSTRQDLAEQLRILGEDPVALLNLVGPEIVYKSERFT